MRFLGLTETCDLGALYLRLLGEGHEVRVVVAEPGARGTMAGLVPRAVGRQAGLRWVRQAGADGVILFESVSAGFGDDQDQLRQKGFQVVGGSGFGDKLENDRAFAQAMLTGLGFPAGHVWEFNSVTEAIDFIGTRPARYVVKFSGPAYASGDNYVGSLADGSDVLAVLRHGAAKFGMGARFILMDFIDGVEVGIGAYFNGEHFLRPACLDFEHKRFFAGDLGELTGEMGTVATFAGSDVLFERTLRKLEPLLKGHRHVGYVNLNTIVNDDGIWPLEFTCRFGYPGFAVLGALQRTNWADLFAHMLAGERKTFDTCSGFSTGVVVTTPPFPYTRKQVDEAVGLPILFKRKLSDPDRRNIHFGEMGISDRQLVTSGLYGWTMVVTGTGATVEASRGEAYRRLGDIMVPRGRYRLDIGERTAGQLAKLRSMGLIGTDLAGQ